MRAVIEPQAAAFAAERADAAALAALRSTFDDMSAALAVADDRGHRRLCRRRHALSLDDSARVRQRPAGADVARGLHGARRELSHHEPAARAAPGARCRSTAPCCARSPPASRRGHTPRCAALVAQAAREIRELVRTRDARKGKRRLDAGAQAVRPGARRRSPGCRRTSTETKGGPCRPTRVTMSKASDLLSSAGLPARDAYDLPTSAKRFADGGQYRIEIPSTEGPRAMDAVLRERGRSRRCRSTASARAAASCCRPTTRSARWSRSAATHGVEVCLFVGPRANWDIGIQAASSAGPRRRVVAPRRRPARLRHRGRPPWPRLGVNSILVADLGQLMLLGQMKKTGDLPPDFVLKTSVTLAAPNPAAARLLEDLGATSLNLPVDLSLPQIAAIRQAVDVADRLLHREPGRFRRRRPPLRDPRDGARCGADLPEVRPAQLAGALSGRPAPRRHGAGALARARAARGHRAGHPAALRAGGRGLAHGRGQR